MKSPFKIQAAFLTIALTSLSFYANAQIHKEKIIASWERAKAYTKEYLDAATQEVYDFKPTPEIKSFAEQMQHIAVENYILVKEACSGVSPLSNYKDISKTKLTTKVEVTQAVMDSYDFAIAAIKSIDDSKMNNTVNMFNKRETSVEDGLSKAFEHQTHQRGQCTIYLRLKGITPPKEKLF